jgi:phosphoglycolate phosphatase-like HAD superfamily hydrolase
MNIFFDVDETILGYDESLRPLVEQVFRQLVEDGHRIYVWSGVRTGDAVRANVVERHGLAAYVTECFRKPLFDFREQWARRGIDVQPDFVVDDYPEIVDAFGGLVVKPYSMARADSEMQLVYEAIREHIAKNGG